MFLGRGMQLRGLVKNLAVTRRGRDQGTRSISYCLRKAAWRRTVRGKRRGVIAKNLLGPKRLQTEEENKLHGSSIPTMLSEQREIHPRKLLSLPNFSSTFKQQSNTNSLNDSTGSFKSEFESAKYLEFPEKLSKVPFSGLFEFSNSQAVSKQNRDITRRISYTSLQSDPSNERMSMLQKNQPQSFIDTNTASIQTRAESTGLSDQKALMPKQWDASPVKPLSLPNVSLEQGAFTHTPLDRTSPRIGSSLEHTNPYFKKLLNIHKTPSIKQSAPLSTSTAFQGTCIPIPLPPKCVPNKCTIPVTNKWKDCKVKKRPKWEGCDKICMPCCCPAFSPPDCDAIVIRHNTCKRAEYRIPSYVECRKMLPLSEKSKKECCYHNWPCPEAGVESVIEPLIRTKHRQEAILGRRRGNSRQ